MMTRKLLATVVVLLMMMTGVGAAETWELDLSAGSTSVTGGLHYKNYVDTGYLRVGGSGVYTDDDDTEYKWVSLDFTVGSDTLHPGLTCDVGLRGILGSAEDPGVSDDVGAVGFTAFADYLFSRDVMSIPLEVFGGLTWAPSPLTFSDTDEYFEFNLGTGLRIIKNASIILSYTAYRVDMESGPGEWDLNDDVLRIGVVMRF